MAHTVGNFNNEKAVKAIIKAEENKAMFMRLRRIIKCENRGALNHLLITDHDGKI